MTGTLERRPAPDPARTSADVESTEIVVSREAGAILLRLARDVVTAVASRRGDATMLPRSIPPDPPAVLLRPSAAFVTLREAGELRGCMGSLATDRSLWQAVVSAAIGAASRDPRFPPVAEDEVPDLAIDVSVLGPPVPLHDPSAFRPGVDGVIVERDRRVGLLLPEVATDQGWGVRDMLAMCCRKAGLPVDAWQDPRTSIMVFRTAHLSELDEGPE